AADLAPGSAAPAPEAADAGLGAPEPGAPAPAEDAPAQPLAQAAEPAAEPPAPPARRPISHYVLLPLYAWGAANWDLAIIEPLLQNSHPTIGFSLAEARHAERVTVVGGEGAVSVDALAMLRKAGCQVERILEDGTLIAT
ncbi:MAG: hypothetical protein ACKOC5_05735, partial [Chloroflexota bacterium]